MYGVKYPRKLRKGVPLVPYLPPEALASIIPNYPFNLRLFSVSSYLKITHRETCSGQRELCTPVVRGRREFDVES
jgi:hypothetical protein